jgi:hypothetical protein
MAATSRLSLAFVKKFFIVLESTVAAKLPTGYVGK